MVLNCFCLFTINYKYNAKEEILMKKCLFFLLIIVPTYINAQIEHVKFMGIPINGNITKFKKQLVKKFKKEKIGLTTNATKYYKKGKVRFASRSIKLKYFNNTLSDKGYSYSSVSCIDYWQAAVAVFSDLSVYDKDYWGEQVRIIIYYDTKSENVYAVRMDVYAKNKENMHRLFNKYRNSMIIEYDYGYPYDFTADGGYNCFWQKIPNSRGNKKIGIAEIYERYIAEWKEYYISIYYYDDINSKKYDISYNLYPHHFNNQNSSVKSFAMR